MKLLSVAILLLCALQVRAQSIVGVINALDVHPIVGFTAGVNREAYIGPAWALNAVTVEGFHLAAGFTRAGFGPLLGYRLIGPLSVAGQWNALFFDKRQSEARFSAGLFLNL